METQYLYNQNDTKIKGIRRFIVCYKVSYSQSIEFGYECLKCTSVEYTQEDRKKFGNTIPDNVKIIGENCFTSNNTSIKSIELPSFVTSLQDNCFRDCKNITNITLPFGLKSLPPDLFSHCPSLKAIEIPQQVSILESNCFNSCKKLETIKIPKSVEIINYNCFGACSSLKSIVLPTNMKKLSASLFDNCYSLSYIDIPSSITSLNYGCFRHCKKLKEIQLPTSLKIISNKCFEECGIDSLIIPSSVQTIEKIVLRIVNH